MLAGLSKGVILNTLSERVPLKRQHHNVSQGSFWSTRQAGNTRPLLYFFIFSPHLFMFLFLFFLKSFQAFFLDMYFIMLSFGASLPFLGKKGGWLINYCDIAYLLDHFLNNTCSGSCCLISCALRQTTYMFPGLILP